MSSASTKIIQAAAGNVETAVEPVGIDFDGSNDYLSRSSDLVGNSDGKEFTFSCWYYQAFQDAQRFYISNDGSDYGIQIGCDNAQGVLRILAANSSGTNILTAISSTGTFSTETFAHILISIDLANASNRYIYVNDVDVTSNFTFSTYTNSAIDKTKPNHFIGAGFGGGGARTEGRLAGVYLDYTYRDLSVEANRRDFIDENGLYVTPPTSGIISVPMDDPDNPGRNDGTGGDFTLNGVVAQSGRGPNQYNAVASEFDGSADYLRSTSLTGVADSKRITFSCIFNVGSKTGYAINFENIGIASIFEVNVSTSNKIIIRIYDNTATVISRIDTNAFKTQGANNSIQISLDTADASKTKIVLNGSILGFTNTVAMVDKLIPLSSADTINIMNNGSSFNSDGSVGEVYFDTSYIDLSTDNPFWDSDAGKPKPVRQVLEETGNTPLIAMPIRADDAGKNLGTGGDFTVNSGPYTGARGASEFWGESAEFNGSSQYLSRTSALTGASDGKVVTFVAAFKLDATASRVLLLLRDETASQGRFNVELSTTGFEITARTSTNSSVLFVDGSWSGDTTNWHTISLSFDFSSASNRHIYIDGSSVSGNFSTYNNLDVEFSADGQRIARNNGSNYLNGKIGFLWFNTEYIDFSQEANRLKFFDAFNNPVDLGDDGSTPTGSQPLIYMNEGFHLGTNLGSGGNFTPQNTPTDGGYVNG